MDLLAYKKDDRPENAGSVRRRLHQLRTGTDIEKTTSPAERAKLYTTIVRRSRSVSYRMCRRDVSELKEFVEATSDPVPNDKHDELLDQLNQMLSQRFEVSSEIYTPETTETAQKPISEGDEIYEDIEDICTRVELLYSRETIE